MSVSFARGLAEPYRNEQFIMFIGNPKEIVVKKPPKISPRQSESGGRASTPKRTSLETL
jgi:hypothetical protein